MLNNQLKITKMSKLIQNLKYYSITILKFV